MSQLTIKQIAFPHYKDLLLPGHLNKDQFNFSKSVKFTLPNKLTLLLVPSMHFLEDRSSDKSWLLLREDDFKIYRSQEIMLLPEKNKVTFKMMVVRKSGRLVAAGKIDFLPNGNTQFEVKFPLTRTGKRMQLLNGIVRKNTWNIKTNIE